MFEILKDIENGVLPLEEIPGFALMLLRQTFWFWIIVIIAFAAGYFIAQ